jgi:hypothetical protein
LYKKYIHTFTAYNAQKLKKIEIIQHLKEFYLLGYNALQSAESQPAFQTILNSIFCIKE